MKLYHSALFAGALVLMVSCSDEAPWNADANTGDGSIKLYLSSTTEVSSKIPQTRSVSYEIVSPDVSEFQVRLSNERGTYIKSWNSVTEFEKEETFPSDDYILEAFYGDPSAQGIVADDEKGHEHAYYYGISDTFRVEPGKASSIQVHTKIANSIIVVEYTDAFKNYFKDFTTVLNTQGEAPLSLGNSEGMCYVIPGEVDIVISAETQNGSQVSLNPAVFDAEAQHLYKIRYNVFNGEVGQADKLIITFNDSPEETDNIVIDLTDDLINGPAPVINAEGFENGSTIENVAGSSHEKQLRFNVEAIGGISEAVLTITSDRFKPDYLTDGSIDLCTATQEQQAKMEQDGIKALGFFKNPDKIATVDLTDLCVKLDEGTHVISLKVKDKGKRVNAEPASLTISSVPVDLETGSLNAIFGEGYAEIEILFNGTDPTMAGKNPFSFKMKGDYGWEDVKILAINDQTYTTRAIEKKSYKYKIEFPAVNLDVVPVNVYYNGGGSPVLEPQVEITYPAYEMEYDPMSTHLIMKVANMDGNFRKELFTSRLRVFSGDNEKRVVWRNTSSGDIIAEGFTESDFANIKTTMEMASVGEVKAFYGAANLAHEDGDKVPNGSFDRTHSYINQEINQGGSFARTWNTNKQNKETYKINEPDDWATINLKTCNFEKTSNKNTWFMVPSAYITNGRSGNGLAIRSVGYNYNGISPSSSGSLTSSTDYNTNVPVKGHSAAGKLFLGSYDIDIQNNQIVSENYNQGVSFSGRPVKLHGYYKYTPVDGTDQGYVEITLLKEGNIIQSVNQNLPEASDWTEFTVDFNLQEYSFNIKPDELKIMFMSSIYGNDSWEVEDANITTKAYTEKIQKFLGSELQIDDLEFIY